MNNTATALVSTLITTLITTDLSVFHVGPINITLHEAECIGLSGPSGCGKSILLKAISDLLESTGEISLYGQTSNYINAPEWRKKVQLIPAESLWWFNTVGEHFKKPINKAQLQRLSLNKNIEQQAVNQLSTGQKQRLALLRALENKPTVLLLDEPTASLDIENTQRVEQLIQHYLKENKASALWVSHDPEQLDRVSNQQFSMNNGLLGHIS